MNTSNQAPVEINRGASNGANGLPLSQSLDLFDLEEIQRLSVEDALRYQRLLGHGDHLGQWETPRHFGLSVRSTQRKIDLAARIKSQTAENLHSHPQLENAIRDGVLYLTRWGLLCRTGPVGFGQNARGTSLDVTTIASRLYGCMSKIVAKGVERRLTSDVQTINGFAALLTPDDLRDLNRDSLAKVELDRMRRLVAASLWYDEPPQVQFRAVTTNVVGVRNESIPENKRDPYQPLPDWYMAEIGPRTQWLIKDLGPNLIHLLNHLLEVQREERFKSSNSLGRCIRDYFVRNDWRDRRGGKLAPPFPLRLSASGKGANPEKTAHAWPPRGYADVISLVATLQRAHLFMALLLMAARHSEVLSLGRDCVQLEIDGHIRVQGKTYKATTILDGKDRKWPAPSILVYAFAQQKELVQVVEKLETLLNETLTLRQRSQSVNEKPANEANHLWGSFGTNGVSDGTAPLESLAFSLPQLARVVGISERPGGINIHPHRLRKTMARLAGIAIEGSPKVLMQLLGHEDVTTTLYYMQSDPAFQQEMEDVIREVRILRMEETIESARDALVALERIPNGGLGGGGAAVLTETIMKHEEWLHRQGKEWGAGDARELAALLADNGRAARLIAPGVVCTKSTHERGLCNSRMGEISPGNCKVECRSHIELAVGRRDVQRVIPILVQHTTTSIENGEWLAAIHNRKQLIHEMSRFPDIGDEWRAKPEVQSLLEHDLEDGQ